jgi:dUTP pyrophosphatase
MVKNETEETVVIPSGTKLAQGVLEKVYQCTFTEIEEVSETDRGNGGFGSTGVTI